MDPYKILGIDSNASIEEIRRAYRDKAKKYHPDRGGDAWAFQQVQQAYEMLTGKIHKPNEKKTNSPETAGSSKPAGQRTNQHAEKGSSAHDQGPFSSGTSKKTEKGAERQEPGSAQSSRVYPSRRSYNNTSVHIIGAVGGGLMALVFILVIVTANSSSPKADSKVANASPKPSIDKDRMPAIQPMVPHKSDPFPNADSPKKKPETTLDKSVPQSQKGGNLETPIPKPEKSEPRNNPGGLEPRGVESESPPLIVPEPNVEPPIQNEPDQKQDTEAVPSTGRMLLPDATSQLKSWLKELDEMDTNVQKEKLYEEISKRFDRSLSTSPIKLVFQIRNVVQSQRTGYYNVGIGKCESDLGVDIQLSVPDHATIRMGKAEAERVDSTFRLEIRGTPESAMTDQNQHDSLLRETLVFFRYEGQSRHGYLMVFLRNPKCRTFKPE